MRSIGSSIGSVRLAAAVADGDVVIAGGYEDGSQAIPIGYSSRYANSLDRPRGLDSIRDPEQAHSPS